MKDIFNKTNAPYLVAGTLATLASLMPGAMFIAFPLFFSCEAHFIGVITGCAVFSAITITALLCTVISKNNTIGKENAELKAQLTVRNAPYLVAGTLATLASLIPVAMSIFPVFFNHSGLDGVIIGCAVFSAIIITALLCAVISKNNTISELKDQLRAVISGKSNTISKQNARIDELETLLRRVGSPTERVLADMENLKTTRPSGCFNIDGQSAPEQLDLSSIDTAKEHKKHSMNFR